MRLSQIRDFVAVVESGGIRAAARKLGVSQPAITRSVRGLEAELHTRLLQRTPTGVVLTEPGRAFLARARAAQAELRKAEEEVDKLGHAVGPVAFGVSPTVSLNFSFRSCGTKRSISRSAGGRLSKPIPGWRFVLCSATTSWSWRAGVIRWKRHARSRSLPKRTGSRSSRLTPLAGRSTAYSPRPDCPSPNR